MKEIGPDSEGVPLDRRRLLQAAGQGLSALALLRGLTACASDEVQPLADGTHPMLPHGAPNPGSVGSVGGAGATPAVTPVGAAPPGVAPPTAPASANPVAPPVVTAPSAPAGPPRVACEVVVTTFPNLADGGPGTSFTRMDQSVRSDWTAIGAATQRMAMKVPDGILNLLRALDELYVGYPISVLAHCLQAATRADKANASDDLVLSALCHKIGMAITVPGHAELSAAILRGYVNDNAYHVVRHHTEFEWMRGGAPGGQPIDQRSRYQSQPWFADAARFVDEWVSVSYDAAFSSRTLADFEPLIRAKFGGGSSVNASTSKDCLPQAASSGAKP